MSQQPPTDTYVEHLIQLHGTLPSIYYKKWGTKDTSCTLVYRIDVHARLLILRKKSTLHGLIWVCTFIDFDKTFPPARLLHPARLLVYTINFSQAKQSKQSYNGYLLTFILQSLKYFSCQIIFHYIFVICTQNYAPLLIF